MKRSRTVLVYHKMPHRTVICAECDAAWEERFVGVATAVGDGAQPICPRCVGPPLTAERVMEAEISVTLLASDAKPEEIRRAVTERYRKYLSQ
jgi:hypothetical protein